MPVSSKEKKRRRVPRAVLVIFYLAAAAYIVATVMAGGTPPGFARLSGVIFSTSDDVTQVGEYRFNVGRSRVFADMDGKLAAAGTLGIQVLDADGSETLRDSFFMQSPAIVSAGVRAVAFDIGGFELRVFDGAEIIAAVQKDNEIVSASINQNGWVAVTTQPGEGYGGLVTIYDDSGRPAFRFFSGDGYVLSALVSPDDRDKALLRLTDYGSQVAVFRLGTDNALRTLDLPGGIIIDIRYMPNGNIFALSTDALLLLERNGRSRELFSFSDRRLGGFAFDDGGFIALHLLDYGVGYHGRIVTLRENGNVIEELVFNREVISMSAADGYLAVLWPGGLMFYDSGLNEFPPYEADIVIAGASRVVAFSGGMALAAGDYSAAVLEIDRTP